MKVILASGSPRRRELLEQVIPEYEIIPATGEEIITSSKPFEVVSELSYQKAEEIFKRNLISNMESLIVIGADTVVSYKENILGKPKDREDAKHMIDMLQGDTHQVYTGVYLRFKGKETLFYDKASVTFVPLSEEEILRYIEQYAPLDKAGAYGVQDGVVVKRYKGSFDTIMGLPTEKLGIILEGMGVRDVYE